MRGSSTGIAPDLARILIPRFEAVVNLFPVQDNLVREKDRTEKGDTTRGS